MRISNKTIVIICLGSFAVFAIFMQIALPKENVNPSKTFILKNITITEEQAEKLEQIEKDMSKLAIRYTIKYANPEDKVKVYLTGAPEDIAKNLNRYKVKMLEEKGALAVVETDILTANEMLQEDIDMVLSCKNVDELLSRAPKSEVIEKWKEIQRIRNQRIKETLPDIAPKLILSEEKIDELAKKYSEALET